MHALSRLANKETISKLEEFHRLLEQKHAPFRLEHRDQPLSSFAADFWTQCFVDLFYRGDCQERLSVRRPTFLPDFLWPKCLLSRADFRGWRMNVEFVACVYNILLRRDQLRAVHMVFVGTSPLSREDARALQQVSAKDFVAEALASGECDSVRGVLRRTQLDDKIRRMCRIMEQAQRSVRGSESEKEGLRPRFTAMRLWGGCSFLFFTLNPHDIRSELTLVFLNHEHFRVKKFSLDFTDSDIDDYLADLLKNNRRRLHEMVAQDPLAATRCFHATVRVVIDSLYNCVKPGKPYADCLPCREEPGIFGMIAGYLGVVEPQMRKALH